MNEYITEIKLKNLKINSHLSVFVCDYNTRDMATTLDPDYLAIKEKKRKQGRREGKLNYKIPRSFIQILVKKTDLRW